jgi:hypothetical protein
MVHCGAGRSPRNNDGTGFAEMTSNEVAANGPLSGDVSLYLKDLACAERTPAPGYYPSINGAELTDA